MKKEITVELLNKILNYLASKPYIEVQPLINEIYGLKDIDNLENITASKALQRKLEEESDDDLDESESDDK